MTFFHPGVDHKHTPSGRWSEVQDNPNSPGAGLHLIAACKIMSPRQLVDTAIFVEFRDKPIALKHLEWYLGFGKGADFNEDANIKLMLETDTGVQAEIIKRLKPKRTTSFFTDSRLNNFPHLFGKIIRLLKPKNVYSLSRFYLI